MYALTSRDAFVVLVYDVTSRETFEEVRGIHAQLRDAGRMVTYVAVRRCCCALSCAEGCAFVSSACVSVLCHVFMLSCVRVWVGQTLMLRVLLKPNRQRSMNVTVTFTWTVRRCASAFLVCALCDN
jgi:hypothetical protein